MHSPHTLQYDMTPMGKGVALICQIEELLFDTETAKGCNTTDYNLLRSAREAWYKAFRFAKRCALENFFNADDRVANVLQGTSFVLHGTSHLAWYAGKQGTHFEEAGEAKTTRASDLALVAKRLAHMFQAAANG